MELLWLADNCAPRYDVGRYANIADSCAPNPDNCAPGPDSCAPGPDSCAPDPDNCAPVYSMT